MAPSVPPNVVGSVRELRYVTFCLGVWDLVARFPFSVTSWWRTVGHNAELQGEVADSKHLEGVACDVVFHPAPAPDAGAFKAAAREVGISAQLEADHWHLELFTTL